jgi:hypothetical protein
MLENQHKFMQEMESRIAQIAAKSHKIQKTNEKSNLLLKAR